MSQMKKTAKKPMPHPRKEHSASRGVHGSSKPLKTSGDRRALAVPDRRAFEVDEVRTKLGMSQAELARITGYSVRAIAGWESGKRLSEAARKKFVETERLRRALAQVVAADKLADWMRSPNAAFEGQTPIQVIERGESDRIWRMIFQIDANVAS